MNIVYIANIQTPLLLQKRPMGGNLSLAGSRKLLLIAKALGESSHSIRFVSSGKTGGGGSGAYAGFEEQMGPAARISYLRTHSNRLKAVMFSFIGVGAATLREIARNSDRDATLIVYNITGETVLATLLWKIARAGAVVIEYEDSALVQRSGRSGRFSLLAAAGERLFRLIGDGAFGPSRILVERVAGPRLLVMEGIVDQATGPGPGQPKQNVLLYSGGLDPSKGLRELMAAVEQAGISLVITGAGEMEGEIRQWCALDPARRIYRGLLPRDELHALMSEAYACVNPHQGEAFRGTLWPFKVAEYLAYNGNVLSTDLPADRDILEQLELIPAGSVAELVDGIRRVMRPEARRLGDERRAWAQNRWGVSSVARQLEPFFRAEHHAIV